MRENTFTASGNTKKVAGEYLMNSNGCPHINITEDFDILKTIDFLPKIFLKATILKSSNRYLYERDLGIYLLGKARAELTLNTNNEYVLYIETSYWDGIADMKTLQERIWAGTILPSISYLKKQKRNFLRISK